MFGFLQGRRSGKPDYLIILSVALLIIVGLVMLSSASSHLGKTRFDDSYYFLKSQILKGLLIGLLGYFIASKFYYRYLQKLAMPLLILNIILLVLVFTPLGLRTSGADRWINLGSFSFQPSEILKLTFILYVAAWAAGNRERGGSFLRGLLPFLILSGVVAGLLLGQPATSMVVILMLSVIAVYFASGAKLSYLAGVVLLGALALSIVVYLTPYRFSRVLTFFQPDSNPYGSGYHISQALTAIGSGSVFGVGLGQSTTKIRYLPEPIGDSIFAVLAEELGFIGSMIVIGLFFVLIIRILLIAQKTSDRFGQLLLVGFASLFALQSFVNIAAISGLIPLTGMPLPFISYGGTSLAVFMTITGVIVNVSKHR